jgi:hypothetical protein
VWKEITKFVNQCKGGWTKKIGRPIQGKVEESLFYGKGGGCSTIFFYKEYYGIMGYYPLVKLLNHWLVIHSTIQRLSNVKLSSGYGTTG